MQHFWIDPVGDDVARVRGEGARSEEAEARIVLERRREAMMEGRDARPRLDGIAEADRRFAVELAAGDLGTMRS